AVHRPLFEQAEDREFEHRSYLPQRRLRVAWLFRNDISSGYIEPIYTAFPSRLSTSLPQASEAAPEDRLRTGDGREEGRSLDYARSRPRTRSYVQSSPDRMGWR